MQIHFKTAVSHPRETYVLIWVVVIWIYVYVHICKYAYINVYKHIHVLLHLIYKYEKFHRVVNLH